MQTQCNADLFGFAPVEKRAVQAATVATKEVDHCSTDRFQMTSIGSAAQMGVEDFNAALHSPVKAPKTPPWVGAFMQNSPVPPRSNLTHYSPSSAGPRT